MTSRITPRTLSNADLIFFLKKYGKQTRLSARQFAGLLPELARRRLYRRHGYASLYEFAAKQGCMSRETVDKVLRLDRRFEKMPHLRAILENGEAGWTKLEVVASVATEATDERWATTVEEMTCKGLSALVKALKAQQEQERINDWETKEGKSQNSDVGVLPKAGDDGEINFSVPMAATPAETTTPPKAPEAPNAAPPSTPAPAPWPTLSFKVSPDTERKLRLIKQKLEKERKETLSLGEVLAALVEGQPPAREEIKVTEVCAACVARTESVRESRGAVRRTISAHVRRLIQARSQGLCEFPGCNRPGEIFHHTRRFVLKRSHDPRFLRLLCEAHERIAQSNLIEHEEGSPSEWRVRDMAPWWDLKTAVDQRVAHYRRE